MNESTIENLLIELLQAQGYSYQHGSETSPQATPQLRSSRDEVLLAPILKAQTHQSNRLRFCFARSLSKADSS